MIGNIYVFACNILVVVTYLSYNAKCMIMCVNDSLIIIIFPKKSKRFLLNNFEEVCPLMSVAGLKPQSTSNS